MHQMHFIYLVVFWNDCHDDMNPDTFVNPLSKVSPRYLMSVISWNLCPERVGFFRPLKSLFLVNRTITISCGLLFSWVLEHHCCNILKASWRSSWTAFQNFPVISILLPSEYSIVWQPFSLCPSVSSFTTKLNSSGNKTPPCGQPLVTGPFRVSPTSVAVSVAQHGAYPTTYCVFKPMPFGNFCYDVVWSAVNSSLNVQECSSVT